MHEKTTLSDSGLWDDTQAGSTPKSEDPRPLSGNFIPDLANPPRSWRKCGPQCILIVRTASFSSSAQQGALKPNLTSIVRHSYLIHTYSVCSTLRQHCIIHGGFHTCTIHKRSSGYPQVSYYVLVRTIHATYTLHTKVYLLVVGAGSAFPSLHLHMHSVGKYYAPQGHRSTTTIFGLWPQIRTSRVASSAEY